MQPSKNPVEMLDATLVREKTEAAMLRSFGDHLGARLNPKSLPLPSGGYLEIDGFSASPAVLCQVYAEVGPVTQEQERITMFDILKLNYAANVLGNTARRVLLFRDQATARWICSNPEVADELGDSGIEVCVAAGC
ncbi:MAG TPA: hypothetical protein VGL53_16175 [Bryobacteraceae bacterium]|jgi:hypothetical protein